jgi:hypothetical protein
MRRYIMNTLTRKRLVDELVEAYVDWRETCAQVNDAYRSWASETSLRERVTFGLYMAALDAEQHAAEVYARLVRRAEKLSWSEDPRANRSAGRRGEVAGRDSWPGP